MSNTKKSIAEKMQAKTLATSRVSICMDGEAGAEYNSLTKELAEVSVREDSLAAEGVTRIAARMNELHDRVQASELTFTFKSLHWTKRLELQATHPPRDGNIVDRVKGYNTDTYPPVLIRQSCMSIEDTEGQIETEVPEEVWGHVFSESGIADFESLLGAAEQATDRSATVPPSARSLLGSQDSGASSRQPGPGTSPQNGSKGGSRRGSRKSTATKKAASSG